MAVRLLTSWATQPLTSFSCSSFRRWFTWLRWSCSPLMDRFSVHFWWFSISSYSLVERELNLGGKVVCSILISKFKPKTKIYWKVCSFFGWWGSMCPASTYGVMGGGGEGAAHTGSLPQAGVQPTCWRHPSAQPEMQVYTVAGARGRRKARVTHAGFLSGPRAQWVCAEKLLRRVTWHGVTVW